jgi:hypothetical protein
MHKTRIMMLERVIAEPKIWLSYDVIRIKNRPCSAAHVTSGLRQKCTFDDDFVKYP